MPRQLLACLVAVVALPGLAAACAGSADRPIPNIREVTATRDMVDGAPVTASTVLVRFDRPATFLQKELPLASRFEFAVPDATADDPNATVRVLVRSAEFEKGSDRSLVLKVDLLIPAGSELRVPKRAFSKNAEGDLAAAVDSDVSLIQAFLASRAFAPSSGALLEGRRSLPGIAADRDTAATRTLLEQHLELRGANDDVKALSLLRYDAISTEQIPSPKLRAALAALTGTFAEGAIEFLLTTNNCTGLPVARVVFEDPPENPDLFARVTHEADGRRVLSVSPRLEGERLERLMALLAHEAIHCDRNGSQLEEVVATALDTFLYLVLMAANAEGILDGTPLTRDLNVDVIALINSGRAVPESIGILSSPGIEQVVPRTSAPYRSFVELVLAAYQGIPASSSAEPLAQQYVDILSEVAGLPQGSAFDLAYLDLVLGTVLRPDVLLAAIGVFGLEPEEP